MLIDTHAHLWFDDFSNDLEEVLARAKNVGVEKIIVPGTDLKSSEKAIELAKKYSGIIYAAVGVHPEELVGHNRQVSPGLADARLNISAFSRDLLSRRDLIKAIGEIGTDASTEELKNCMAEQKILFKTQCEMAIEHDLPVIIHSRDSLNETLEVLDTLKTMPKGQFHCFSHDSDGLKKVLMRGFYVSFCGNITWSKRVSELVKLVPSDRLLLETDSPFMTPRDKKGIPMGGTSRNEPNNIGFLVGRIAELRGNTQNEIENLTSENVNTLYRL